MYHDLLNGLKGVYSICEPDQGPASHGPVMGPRLPMPSIDHHEDSTSGCLFSA